MAKVIGCYFCDLVIKEATSVLLAFSIFLSLLLVYLFRWSKSSCCKLPPEEAHVARDRERAASGKEAARDWGPPSSRPWGARSRRQLHEFIGRRSLPIWAWRWLQRPCAPSPDALITASRARPRAIFPLLALCRQLSHPLSLDSWNTTSWRSILSGLLWIPSIWFYVNPCELLERI